MIGQTMLATGKKLDWSGWLRGLFGAAISGGAGSIASGFAANLADPAHDINIFKVMWITFLVSAAVSLAKFLQVTPTPQEVDKSGPAPTPGTKA